MSLPPVPANIAPYFKQAANYTGLPLSVVAAQNLEESGYGTNDGPSRAGAVGPWQFISSTWSQYSSDPFSAAWQWAPATDAYAKYMKALLEQFHGNVRDALAGYNAGPGNLQAGYGYADTILANAGQSGTITVGSSSGTGGKNETSSGGTQQAQTTSFNPVSILEAPIKGLEWMGNFAYKYTGLGDINNSIQGLAGTATALAGLAKTVNQFVMLWALLFQPQLWLRVGAAMLGMLALIGGIFFVSKAM